MISSKFFSALKPILSASLASKRPAQPATILATKGSSTRLIRATALSPAALRKDSISSPTVAETPGIVMERCTPKDAVSMVAAVMKKPTAARGLGKDEALLVVILLAFLANSFQQ